MSFVSPFSLSKRQRTTSFGSRNATINGDVHIATTPRTSAAPSEGITRTPGSPSLTMLLRPSPLRMNGSSNIYGTELVPSSSSDDTTQLMKDDERLYSYSDIKALRQQLDDERSGRTDDRRRFERERIDSERALHRQLGELKRKVAEYEVEQAEQRLATEQRTMQHNNAVEDLQTQITSLQQKMRYVYESASKHKEQWKALEAQSATLRKTTDQKVSELSRQNEELQARAKQHADEVKTLTDSSTRRCSILQQQYDLLQTEHQTLQQYVDKQSQQLQDYHALQLTVNATNNDLTVSKLRVTELEQQLLNVNESSQLIDSYKQRNHAYVELERMHKQAIVQLKNLQSTHRNAELQQLKISEFESKVQRQQQQLQELNQQSYESQTVKAELKQWTDSMAQLFPTLAAVSTHTVTNAIRDLQEQQLQSRDQQHQQTVTSNQSDSKLQELNSQLKLQQSEVQKLQLKLQARDTELVSLQTQSMIAVKERDRLKALLSNYDAEDTVEGHDQQRIQRITELEESYSQLQQQLKDQQALQSRVTELELQGKQYEQHLQKSETEVERLHKLLGQGYFDSNSTKVLHTEDNPLQQAKQQKYGQRIAALEAENKQLREQKVDANHKSHPVVTLPALLQTPRASYGDDLLSPPTPMQPTAQANGTVVDINTERQRLAAEADKRVARLRAVFHEKVQQFREAMYLMTGYKVEMLQNNEYKLKCMYFDTEHDSLLMKLSIAAATNSNAADSTAAPEHQLSVLETPLIKKLDRSVLRYLSEGNSIPAFLAAITLDYFSKQTRAI